MPSEFLNRLAPVDESFALTKVLFVVRKVNETDASDGVGKTPCGLGPKGLGGLYSVDGLTGSAKWSLDVSTLGVNVGAIPTNAARGLLGRTDASSDSGTFALVGRAGLGDIEVSEDDTTLWFTSLADNRLYAMLLPSDGSAPTESAIGYSVVSLGDKPMAVAPHDGKIYVGVACSDGSKAEVVAFDPAESRWSSSFQFSLNYTKGCARIGLTTQHCNWNPWTDTYNSSATETLPATSESDTLGYYRFDELPAGTYIVRVTGPDGYISSSLDSLNPNDDIDSGPTLPSDNGVGSSGVASGTVTLGGIEPTLEADLVPGPNPQGGPDNQGNMTVDFGFYRPSTPTTTTSTTTSILRTTITTTPTSTVPDPIILVPPTSPNSTSPTEIQEFSETAPSTLVTSPVPPEPTPAVLRKDGSPSLAFTGGDAWILVLIALTLIVSGRKLLGRKPAIGEGKTIFEVEKLQMGKQNPGSCPGFRGSKISFRWQRVEICA